LTVSLIGGFTPQVGDTFTIIDNDGTADAIAARLPARPRVRSSTPASTATALRIWRRRERRCADVHWPEPVLANVGGPVNYTENAAGIPLSSTATVSDVDSPDFDTGGMLKGGGLSPMAVRVIA